MKLVVLDGETTNPGDLSWEPLAALGPLTVYPNTPREQLAERMADAEVVFSNRNVLNRRILEACPKLRYVGLLSTGYNLVDTGYAKERGIVVANAPGYSTYAVAQHTIALLLEICNAIGGHNREVHAGRWDDELAWSFREYPMTELAGKTFGCIGFGSIGKAAGRIAAALGMEVLATGSHPTGEGRAIGNYVELDELLAQADVVSLHCPLLPGTKGIIHSGNLAKMKKGAMLLNTARGGLVVEEDLAAVLHSGQLAAAGLDVADPEPIRPDSPLLTAPHCIITPHVAWMAREARAKLIALVAENFKAFLAGSPQNQVNR